jgi:hypothetical protein
VVRTVYSETVPDGAVGPHWAVGTMPPEAFYAKVTEAFVRFERERKSNGWPEFIYCPIDEVNVGAKEFGSRVYAALKKAGVRTYITKDPKSPDAPAYAPAVDFWCSQPFSVPYEQVISGKAGYWCYPNHNAGEIKEPLVMCKGGRMTYGYGFWRSGYTVIIPWHWRWQSGPDPFDYLRGSTTSGCGVRLDDDGEVIPTPYWECFREGYDDARYLYTLQSAIVEREGSSNPKLRKLAEEGKNLLQEIWSSIRVREKYLDEGLWASNDFDIVRWRVAKLTERLISYPALRKAAAPSVLVADTAARAPEDPPVEPGPGDEALDLGDEDFSRWRSGTAEGTVSMTETSPFQGAKALRFVIAVDHAKDGGEGGNYPVGWPRLTTEFPEGPLDLTLWDILSFAVRADRSRGNSLVLSTPFSVNARATERGVAADRTFDLGDRLGVWTPLRIPISDLISAGTRPTSPWKSTRTLQFSVAESRFPDGARITLDFDSVALVRFASPRISGLTAPRWIVPNRPVFTISFDLLGASSVTPGSHTVRAVLLDHSGKHAAETSADLAANRRIVLEVGALPPGTYRLRVEIADASGKVCSAEEREVLGVEGW